MTEADKKWIDGASLDQLLSRYRFAESGDSMMQGETYDYFSKKMFGMRDADNAAWVRASKSVGW